MADDISERLEYLKVPTISEWDEHLGVAWFIPREVIEKKTKNGRVYWLIKVIDSTNKSTAIKCWAVKAGVDRVFINRPYMAKLDYNEQWGFSTRSIRHAFKLLA